MSTQIIIRSSFPQTVLYAHIGKNEKYITNRAKLEEFNCLCKVTNRATVFVCFSAIRM